MRISDWSSDVCSSDVDVGLGKAMLHAVRLDIRRDADEMIAPAVVFQVVIAAEPCQVQEVALRQGGRGAVHKGQCQVGPEAVVLAAQDSARLPRSEESRVGKECVRQGRFGGWP